MGTQGTRKRTLEEVRRELEELEQEDAALDAQCAQLRNKVFALSASGERRPVRRPVGAVRLNILDIPQDICAKTPFSISVETQGARLNGEVLVLVLDGRGEDVTARVTHPDQHPEMRRPCSYTGIERREGGEVNYFPCIARPLRATMVGGRAQLDNLKFQDISKKHGNYYQFRVAMERKAVKGEHDTQPVVCPAYSSPVVVRSARLEYYRKKLVDLVPDNPLVKLPNVGKKYAEKLSSRYNCRTIGELSDLLNGLDEAGMQGLVDDLKEKRDKLSIDILKDIRRDANAVLGREMPEDDEDEDEEEEEGEGDRARSPRSLQMPDAVPEPQHDRVLAASR